MAHQTLPASPSFQEANAAILLNAWRIGEQLAPESLLGSCDWNSPVSSIDDVSGYSCSEKATVHRLADEQEYCLSHFQEVERG